MARWRFRHCYITVDAADHNSRFFLLSNSYKSQDENGNTFLRILLPLDEVVKHLVSPCYQLYVRRGCKKYGQALIE